VALKWGLLKKEVVEQALKNDLRKIALDGIKGDGLIGIRRVIAQGLTRGDSYPKMTRGVKQFIEREASGYLRIARTRGAAGGGDGPAAGHRNSAR
jgi:hypothetical protein